MINLDDELAQGYLAECCERLIATESDLLTIEKGGPEVDEELVNRVYRTAHWLQAGASFFGLVKIRELAHQTEEVLALIGSRELAPTPDRVSVLLRATDSLQGMVQNAAESNQADTAEVMSALKRTLPGHQSAALEGHVSAGGSGVRHLRMLLAEDDFASRLLLQSFLSRYGECHVAVNGREAVEAFRYALERGQRYDLICMDIMMPEMDGREAVRQIRALEEEHEIVSTSGAKITMTTAVDDMQEVFRCFHELCDAYLIKPIDLGKLLNMMKSYELVA
jgi:two-component system, chemotaxis family, chemotaxis protein CheY